MSKYTFVTILFVACLWLGPSACQAEHNFTSEIVRNALNKLKLNLNATIWSKLPADRKKVYLEKVQNFRLCYNSAVGRQHIDIFTEKLSSIVQKYFVEHKHYGHNKTLGERIQRVLHFLKSLRKLAKQVLSCMIDVSNGKKPSVYGLTGLSGMSPSEFRAKMLIPRGVFLRARERREKERSTGKTTRTCHVYSEEWVNGKLVRPIVDKHGHEEIETINGKVVRRLGNGCDDINKKKDIKVGDSKGFKSGNKNVLIIEAENNKEIPNPMIDQYSQFPTRKMNHSMCLPYNSKSYKKVKPDTFTWQDHNMLSEVRLQGQCASCWVFNAIDLAEISYRRWNNIKLDKNFFHPKNIRLATQDILDCANTKCNGDDPAMAFSFINFFGSAPDKSNPYVANWNATRGCVAHKPIFKIGDFCRQVELKDDIENGLKTLLLDHGPLLVAIEGNSLHHLRGVFNGNLHHKIDHALLLVGWNRDYWIMKNSWGKCWGVDGYLYIGKQVNSGLEKAIYWLYPEPTINK